MAARISQSSPNSDGQRRPHATDGTKNRCPRWSRAAPYKPILLLLPGGSYITVLTAMLIMSSWTGLIITGLVGGGLLSHCSICRDYTKGVSGPTVPIISNKPSYHFGRFEGVSLCDFAHKLLRVVLSARAWAACFASNGSSSSLSS